MTKSGIGPYICLLQIIQMIKEKSKKNPTSTYLRHTTIEGSYQVPRELHHLNTKHIACLLIIA
jgi:hypothetical protein